MYHVSTQAVDESMIICTFFIILLLQQLLMFSVTSVKKFMCG